MRSALWLALVVTLSCGVAGSSVLAQTTVNYHGGVNYRPGMPVVNGFAIAGTFASGFDPYDYKYVYGMDEWGNMDETHYSDAVADGNFLPIGGGSWTNTSGYFSGAGTTYAPEGTTLWLFVFDNPDPNAAANFGLGTSTSLWKVPAVGENFTLDTGRMNAFVFGSPGGGRIVVGGLPIPEPGTAILAFFAPGGLLAVRRWRRRAT